MIFEEPDNVDPDPFATMIKSELLTIIRWAEQQNPRASQKEPGPSEIGDPCDRRLGYRIAEVPAVNFDFDPWAAIVGTAVHSWLDTAVKMYVSAQGALKWSTETELMIDTFIRGHSDLYSHEHEAVIDWKGAGPDVMRKVRKDGPPESYQVQTHVYGYGFEQRGWPVRKVVLAFFPRAGWIKDMFVWSADYDRNVAEAALARMYRIAQEVLSLEILKESNSHRWEFIEATPSNTCGWCPWYDPGRDADRGADKTGCPGR